VRRDCPPRRTSDDQAANGCRRCPKYEIAFVNVVTTPIARKIHAINARTIRAFDRLFGPSSSSR
jgi:hypothetical protein